MLRKVSFTGISIVLLFLVSALGFMSLNKRLIHMRKSFRSKLKKYKRRERINEFIMSKALVNSFTFPKELVGVPFASESLVKSVKQLDLRGVYAPYNPTIHKCGDNYQVFFRYDKIRQLYSSSINSYIGWVELDHDFNQTARDFQRIETGTSYAEDPRVFTNKGKQYLVYNDLLSSSKRAMHVGEVSLENSSLQDITLLDLKIKNTEKNWVPFTYSNANDSELYFEYQIAGPREILKVQELSKLSSVASTTFASIDKWTQKWGNIGGGTPAQLIGDEYLAFFHSKFIDKLGIFWYVMGAYTFEAEPPFRLKSISPYPLLFEGIYCSPHLNTADPRKCVIFPSGYVFDEDEDHSLIHLACGENDSACKIITLDKEQLVKTLIPVK